MNPSVILNPGQVTIRRAFGGDIESCLVIRLNVFVDEQQVPPWEEADDFDEIAEHYLATVDGMPAGTARIVPKGDAAKIGRVAVSKEYRGLGLGILLMEFVLDQCVGRFQAATLDSQLTVIPFYEKFGFLAEGEEFLDGGIMHRKMTRRL